MGQTERGRGMMGERGGGVKERKWSERKVKRPGAAAEQMEGRKEGGR